MSADTGIFMTTKDTSVCLRLGEERKRLNLNQNKVAGYCEVSVKTVGRWEKNIPIPADKLSLLAQLGYDISYIITGIKLSPQTYALEAATHSQQTDDAVSKDQEVWLNILENLVAGDNERLKQIGLALVGYSQAKTGKPA